MDRIVRNIEPETSNHRVVDLEPTKHVSLAVSFSMISIVLLSIVNDNVLSRIVRVNVRIDLRQNIRNRNVILFRFYNVSSLVPSVPVINSMEMAS